MQEKCQFLRRPRILPTSNAEIPYLLLLLVMIPVTYWFEVWVVLPTLFHQSTITFWIFFTLAHFLLHNIIGNFLGIVMCDTSIRGRRMPTEEGPGVKFCSVCETLTPPRSYHCPTCNICILKRDHHCVFSSCCIGHYNHRYFILFIFYMLLATLISLPFNIYFLWDALTFSELSFVATMIFPVIMFLVDMGPDNIDINTMYIVIFTINIAGLIFCAAWFYFHIRLIITGKVVHEMRRCISSYNLGKEMNLKMVLGERWYLTWISPFLFSELPSDGITFQLGEKED